MLSSPTDIEKILRLYREAKPRAPLPDGVEATTTNKLCGEEYVTWQMRRDNQQLVHSFHGDLCAVSTAAAEHLYAALGNDADVLWLTATPEQWLAELPFELPKQRHDCALLPFEACQKAWRALELA